MKRASNSNKEKRDLQVEEFLARDLGEDIERSGSMVMIRPKRPPTPTSIALAPTLIAKLKEKGAKRSIGYQTLLKIILYEHVDEY
jgi:predicted DNA binding CopG/RHH family protein